MCKCTDLHKETGGKVPWNFIEVPAPAPGAIRVRMDSTPWVSGCYLGNGFSHSIAAFAPTAQNPDVWMVPLPGSESRA